MKRTILAMTVVFVLSGSLIADVKLPAVIGDSMVLQRDTKVAVWGWADPGEKVTVRGSWSWFWNKGVSATTDKDGKWKVMLKTAGAGGPYTVNIKGKNTIELKDVLLGEVWVCSGQSNMEWNFARLKSSGGQVKEQAVADVAAAHWPEVRLFTVDKATSSVPLDDCTGNWSSCTPETVEPFSAVGYFFGAHIHKEIGVPVGLIHSSWGGTVAEAWTSRPVIDKFGEFEERLKAVDEDMKLGIETDEQMAKRLDLWQQKYDQAAVGEKQKWFSPSFDDSDWDKMPVPGFWPDINGHAFDGIIWHRHVVDLPADWKGRDLVIELGKIDDNSVTWFNGQMLGSTTGYSVDREFKIDAAVAKVGENLVCVKVIDRWGYGGLYSEPQDLKIYPEDQPDRAIGLAGNWKYKPTVDFAVIGKKPGRDRLGQNSPTALYNGMIAPLIPYGIKGAIWYQGESNRRMAEQYGRLFPLMIQNWRHDWGQGDFPFYYVQIAPYKYEDPDGTPGALLREAQFKTLSMNNVGMAVTMDIGDSEDIHPTNKRDVGKRLALWALANNYRQKDLVYSGPLYESMQIEGYKIRLKFKHVNGGLVSKGGELTHFTIAGPDREFVEARAVIEDDTVVVSSAAVKEPVAVRYGFTNAAQPNLFNQAGLPASSFRTDDWQCKPNFVFILVDDLGWTDLGCFGSFFYETPHLDKFAAESMKFTNAYAASPVCSPTRASIMTGKYPARMDTTDWFGAPQPQTAKNHRTKDKPLLPAPYSETMSLKEVTLAEALKERGYKTFFAGKWHLGQTEEYWPEHQGFDVNKGGWSRGGPYGPGKYFVPYGNPRLKDGPEGEHLPDRLATETVEFIKNNINQPFLAYLSFYSVHTPLQSREDLKQKYLEKKQRLGLKPEWGKEDRQKVRLVQEHAVYAGMVEAMDAACGKVLSALKDLGLDDNTVVFFMSDNGGLSTAEGHPTSNLPLRGGKGWMYEGGIREPMMVKWPGVTPAGTVCDEPVTSTDFYPTMLEMSGSPSKPDQHVDGKSWVPLLKGKTLERGPLYWHYPHYGNQGGSPASAIRDGDWKLIVFYEDNRGIELYNLKDDISETKNLAPKHPQIVQKLHTKLKAWLSSVEAKFPSPNPDAKQEN